MKKIRIMFVCLGNICRSPLAEALFRQEARSKNLEGFFEIASSGTGDWHIGKSADRRMRQTAGDLGVSLDGHRAQQLEPFHLEEFDHVFVMDKSNLHDVLFLDHGDRYGHKVRLFREFDPDPGDFQVPDPYFGGQEGFNEVYSIVQRTARSILHHLVEEHGLSPRAHVDRPT
jgi:protein-tyrosine phosphatase